jgi:ATP-binding cassette subfamily B protein
MRSTVPSTRQVAYRLLRNEPVSYASNWIQWVGFHLAPIPAGLLLKAILDRLAADQTGTPWLLVGALAGVEVARWTLLVSAAFHWQGAWVGWQTVPRVNLLRSLATGGGPAAGRLPASPGEAVSRFRDDSRDLALVLDVWLDVSGALAAAAAALVVIALIDPLAAVAVVAPVSIALVASALLGPRLRAWRRAAREAGADVTGFIGDTFGAILAVKTGGAEEAVDRRFGELNRARASAARRDQLGSELIRSLGYGTGEITIGVVLLLVAGRFQRGELTVGDIALFTSYVTVVAGVPKWVGRLAAYHRQADVSIDRLAELLPTPERPAVVAPTATHLRHGPPPLPAVAGHDDPLDELRLESLTAIHAGTGRGIEGVDLVIRAGELVAVTGRVGAGKSTLLRALLGLIPMNAGSVAWNGHQVDDPAEHLRPPRVAYLPQVPRLFSEPLADTVLLGIPDDRLERSLWLACLDEDLADMPDGIRTLLGPRGLRLSGGQIQRVAAARALARRADLLVVDDLSSALDADTEHRLWSRLAGGGFTTTLVVTHRADILERADQTVLLEDGRVVEVG